MIAGLLLAAGRSTRFGSDKLLAPLRGHPVLFWSAAAIATEVDALYVVLPPDSTARRAAVAGAASEIVEHAGRDAGMASSIRAGVAALPEAVEAVVVALADQPLVSSAVVRMLCDRWRRKRADAVVPRYRDGRGHPVLFDRAMFGELSRLDGDTGARELLRTLGDRVAVVPVSGHTPVDVDTPEALHALAMIWQGER
jgi:molybdenum cofactor cytidylyltransferase